ncbi:MAG: hypothetical protein Q4Q03_03825 [Bowdeniella nasicola]|nr:hypothetical protein [Bowdeniella nasicola]
MYRPSLQAERGSATVEFTAVTLLVIIPLTYLFLTLLTIQQAAFATAGAARHGARVVAEARSDDGLQTHLEAIEQLTAAQLHLDAHAVQLQLQCETTPGVRGGARVEVNATVVQPLPLIPQLFAFAVPTSIDLHSRAVAIVNPYLARP